jgi:hypothetical protein
MRWHCRVDGSGSLLAAILTVQRYDGSMAWSASTPMERRNPNYDPGAVAGSVLSLVTRAGRASPCRRKFSSALDGMERHGLGLLLGGSTAGYSGRLQFSTNQYYVDESRGPWHTITVLRTRFEQWWATVSFSTSDGNDTGLPDNDRRGKPGLPEGRHHTQLYQRATSATVPVPIIDDSWGEFSESTSLSHKAPGRRRSLGPT